METSEVKERLGGLGIFINHTIFGFEKDIYLGNVYIVPEGSTYLKYDEFNLLYQQIPEVPDDSEIALCGDFNARTGVTPDFDLHFYGSYAGLNELLPADDRSVNHLISVLWQRNVLTRASKDKTIINRHGIHLLELCKSTGMLILNGRLGRDKDIGEFTRDDTTGKSVVDYVISTPKLFKVVQDFRVHDKFPESDHRPLSLSLFTARTMPKCKVTQLVKWKPHNEYIWSRGDLHRLTDAMDDLISESYRLSIMDSVASLFDVDTVAGHFDKHISQACERTFRQKPRKHKANKKGAPHGMMLNAGTNGRLLYRLGSASLVTRTGNKRLWLVVNIEHANSVNNGCILGNVLRKLNPHISMTVAACGEC